MLGPGRALLLTAGVPRRVLLLLLLMNSLLKIAQSDRTTYSLVEPDFATHLHPNPNKEETGTIYGINWYNESS